MELVDLFEVALDDRLPVCDRMAAIDAIEASTPSSALGALEALVLRELPQVLEEGAARALARVTWKLGSHLSVDLADFSGPAYLAFDEEMTRLLSSDANHEGT